MSQPFNIADHVVQLRILGLLATSLLIMCLGYIEFVGKNMKLHVVTLSLMIATSTTILILVLVLLSENIR